LILERPNVAQAPIQSITGLCAIRESPSSRQDDWTANGSDLYIKRKTIARRMDGGPELGEGWDGVTGPTV